ncbi:MAG: hypothetical protein HKO59_16120 [Phycisphaerales bacterium]|nr:type II secretion system protein GspG [Phycisphaerae bacterium]NNF42935.1 hypothetical protein [Phycisphaerales bacterium]NNM27478.1 hypothetical protein [Phycisphaerales bacterium]
MTQVPLTPHRVEPINGLGIAGFICSMVGLLVTGGLLCPVGLIISLIACGRRPRGFAIAGVVVGFLGTCGWVLIFVFAGAAILAALGIAAVAVVLTEAETVEITSDMVNIAIAVKGYEQENDFLPASLDDLTLKSATRLDPWGNRYEYHLTDEPPGYELVSAGEDGRFGSTDDVALSGLGDAWNMGAPALDVHGDGDGGSMTVRLGDRTITAEGDEDDGRLLIDLGDRVIEIEGDDVSVTTKPEGDGGG